MITATRGTTRRALRWTHAAAAGCAGLVLWSAPHASAADPAVPEERSLPQLERPLTPFVQALAPEDTRRRDGERETMLRLLAEEMTSRLVAALSTQARAHAGEIVALELRARAAEERAARAEEARTAAEAGLRSEIEGIRALLAEAEDVSGDLRNANAGLTAALGEMKGDTDRLKGALARSLTELAGALRRAGQLALERETADEQAARVKAEAEALAAELETTKAARQALAVERETIGHAAEATAAKLAELTADHERIVGERDALRSRAEGIAAALAKLKTEGERLGGERDELRVRLEATTALATRLKAEGERAAGERDAQRARAEAAGGSLARLKADHEQVTAERDSLRGRAEAAAGALAMVRAEGERVTGEREALRAQAEAAAEALVRLRAERERVETERDTLRAQAEAAAAALVDLKALAARVTAERDALDGQAGSANGELVRLRAEHDRLIAERDALRERAAANSGLLADLRVERDRLIAERDLLKESVDDADRRTADKAEADGQALASQALERLGQIEQFISSTGIDVQRLAAPVAAKGAVVPPPLPAARLTGARGGPFVPDVGPSRGGSPRSDDAAIQLERQIDRMERVERILRVLPLGAPLAQYGMESGFGPRIDPFRRRAAMHEGVDLSAPMRTPIRATAPGTVVHSGWKSAYGNMVDLEHASGLRTRYAHLAETKVAVGAQVQRGEVVGLLGSTGRSTGAHVHYEVIVGGAPVNPVRFIGPRR
ncbi:MAG: peptidoglycan DD-metalloendopeptidase family protein [Alphaproteobacteria bacterium]|nr:peptidoglycan DD-metalloendopeptidase family protein [Alphaproteobacteria bacterium]